MTAGTDHSRPSWERALAFGALFVGCLALFGDSWSVLAERWMKWSHGYDHGWLIAGIVAWLGWRERAVIAAGRPCWPGLLLVLMAAAVWFVGRAADVVIIQEAMLPALLWTAVLTVFGSAAARAFLFPIGFLYFAVPVWDYANGFLQAVTTAVVGTWVSASGVPALIEGNFVSIPAGRFEIAAGCAGQAFFVTAGALAALYGHLHYRQWGRRALLLVVAFAGAMVVNWVRVYIVIMAGHFTDMQHYLVRVDHYTFGWVLFALALIPFYWFARRLEGAPDLGPVVRPATDGGGPRPVWPALVVTLLVLGLPVLAWSGLASRPMEAATVPSLPGAPAGWERVDERPPSWQPDFKKADKELWARFEPQGTSEDPVDLWIIHYASQSQGKELIYYANRMAKPREWQVENQRKLRLDPPMREALLVGRNGDRRLVRWWYEVGGWNTTSPTGAKLRQIAGRLTGRPEASLVAFSTTCEADCEQAAARLEAFSLAINRELRAAVYSVEQEGSG